MPVEHCKSKVLKPALKMGVCIPKSGADTHSYSSIITVSQRKQCYETHVRGLGLIWMEFPFLVSSFFPNPEATCSRKRRGGLLRLTLTRRHVRREPVIVSWNKLSSRQISFINPFTVSALWNIHITSDAVPFVSEKRLLRWSQIKSLISPNLRAMLDETYILPAASPWEKPTLSPLSLIFNYNGGSLVLWIPGN